MSAEMPSATDVDSVSRLPRSARLRTTAAATVKFQIKPAACANR
jgi:hypothetical protein